MSIAGLDLDPSNDAPYDYYLTLDQWCQQRWKHLKEPLAKNYSGQESERFCDKCLELAKRILTFVPLVIGTLCASIFGGINHYITGLVANHIVKQSTARYTLIERIFRTCVFQTAVYSYGFVEKCAIYLYRACVDKTLCPRLFNPERLESSLNIFRALGAEEHFVTPDDQKASIHMMHFKATELEKQIVSKGGSWQKIRLDDGEQNEVLAILPPSLPSARWEELEKNFLSKMGWEKRTTSHRGRKEEVLVTCNEASLIDPSKHFCFLHCHSSGNSFAQERKRAGFFLGMKQDICFFDQRGIGKSKGAASEAGYYLDSEAVYAQLLSLHPYTASQIWITGSCQGAAMGAHLKSKYHGSGINFVAEQSFSSMERDVIDNTPMLARYLAKRNLTALKSRDIPDHLKPKEDYFSAAKKWRSLSYYTGSGGKCAIIHALNDTTLAPDTQNRYFRLVERVNAQRLLIEYTSKEKNGHEGSTLDSVHVRTKLTQFIFQ